MESAPVIDQGDFDVCRYVTATELIQAALSYRSPGSKPLSWASLYANTTEGVTQNAVRMMAAARTEGVCTVDSVKAAVRAASATCKEVAYARALLSGDHVDLRGAAGACGDIPTEQAFGSEFSARTRYLLAKSVGAAQSSNQSIRQALDQYCSANKVSLPFLGDVRYTFGYNHPSTELRTKEFEKHFDGALAAAEPVPIAVAYCADVLVDRSATGVDPINGKHSRVLCTKTGLHASVVIGRRMSGGQCQYLVKNSWGNQCNGNGQYAYDSRHQCEGGKLWINGKDLTRNSIYAYSLGQR
jgi:hypothetical protein